MSPKSAPIDEATISVIFLFLAFADTLLSDEFHLVYFDNFVPIV